MKDFFRKRKLNLQILILFSLLAILAYVLGRFFGQYRELFFYPVLALSLPLIISLLTLIFFPIKVFKVWFVLGIPTLLAVLGMTFGVDELGCSWGVCFSRSSIAIQLSAILFGNLIWISIILAFIWHFWEKYKEKRLINKVN